VVTARPRSGPLTQSPGKFSIHFEKMANMVLARGSTSYVLTPAGAVAPRAGPSASPVPAFHGAHRGSFVAPAGSFKQAIASMAASRRYLVELYTRIWYWTGGAGLAGLLAVLLYPVFYTSFAYLASSYAGFKP
jgi:hypothetical protein